MNCFWQTGCSDSARCQEFGQCVAAHQNAHKGDMKVPILEGLQEAVDTACATMDDLRGQRDKYAYALLECVKVLRVWHGEEVFDIYYNHSPEMKPIRDALGLIPEGKS